MVRVSCKVHLQLSVLHHFSYLVDLSFPKILHPWAFLINARFLWDTNIIVSSFLIPI